MAIKYELFKLFITYLVAKGYLKPEKKLKDISWLRKIFVNKIKQTKKNVKIYQAMGINNSVIKKN